ncbi:MAG: multiheme c-type cytochrome [Myxococcota bacterium]
MLAPGLASAAPTQPNELQNPLVRADQCEYCHSYNNAPELADDPLYAPFFTWRGSMMANAARDPVFWAAVAVASQDAEDPAETEACIRCHSPRAFLEGRGDAIAQADLLPEDLAGVECEVCHRMEADAPPGNAHMTIDDVLVGANVPRRGPWSYPEGGPIPAPPHEVIADEFVGSSELCGTCHDVTTDRERVDEDGVGLGALFNEQRTYSEWANSEFAVAGADFASCQDCHMPAVQDMAGCRDHIMEGHAHAEGGRRHDLLGANRFVIELLADDAPILQSVAFEHTLSLLDDFVQSAASLEVQAPESVNLGEGLADLTVTVTNETGHKLPTGYSEGRVMWLEVIATHDGEEIGSSGVWDQTEGRMTDDPQLRQYRAVAVEHSSGETFHLLRNNFWVEDTRIPPRGLVPDFETDPVTDRYELLGDGTWPNFDTHTYTFAGRPELAEIDGGTVSVTVRLLYLINTAAYVDFLAEENETNAAGDDLAARFATAGGAPPLVLAEETVEIPVVGAEPSGTSTGSMPGGTSSSTGELDGTGGATSTGSLPESTGTTAGDGTGDVSSGQDEDPDGCSCRSQGQSTPLWGMTMLLLARRRRRTQ